MTVGGLIHQLQTLDPKLPVAVQVGGNLWRGPKLTQSRAAAVIDATFANRDALDSLPEFQPVRPQ